MNFDLARFLAAVSRSLAFQQMMETKITRILHDTRQGSIGGNGDELSESVMNNDPARTLRAVSRSRDLQQFKKPINSLLYDTKYAKVTK